MGNAHTIFKDGNIEGAVDTKQWWESGEVQIHSASSIQTCHLYPLFFLLVQGWVIHLMYVCPWSNKEGQIKMLSFAFTILKESHFIKLRWHNDLFFFNW